MVEGQRSRSGKPLVNSWTEWGDLELVVVGNVQDDHCVPFKEPAFEIPLKCPHHPEDLNYPVGQSHPRRIALAQAQLNYLRDVLEGEMVQVKPQKEFNNDLHRDMIVMKSNPQGYDNEQQDVRTVKHLNSQVLRPQQCPTYKTTNSPWWEAKLQWGPTVPRDTNITMGNTILEAPMSFRARYFDNYWYRDIVYDLWTRDDKVRWLAAPKPTMKDDMYNLDFYKYQKPYEERIKIFQENNFVGGLLNKEMAFDAADMMRYGRDVFVRKGQSCNNKGLQWLRREFPHLRFHQFVIPSDYTRHADEAIVPIRGPTSGSPGIVILHQHQYTLEDNLKLFKENDWQMVQLPEPQNTDYFCLQGPGAYISSNLLSISSKCLIIEEQEVEFYHILEDLGFDVITIPFKNFPMYGGAIHCATWDIRRDDDLQDFFPNQDYEAELLQDLENPSKKVADFGEYKYEKFNGIVKKYHETLPSTQQQKE